MALNIPAPVASTEIPKRREYAGKDKGPNFFLIAQDGAPDGYLARSFDNERWEEVTVPGAWEDGVIQKGGRKGEPVRRMTGDAMEVTRMLRAAADELGIGVSVKYVEQTYDKGAKKGQPTGQIIVKYLGQARRQSQAGEAPEEASEE